MLTRLRARLAGAKTVMGRTASLIGSVDAQPRFARVLLRVMGGLIALSLVVVCTVLGFLSARYPFCVPLFPGIMALTTRRGHCSAQRETAVQRGDRDNGAHLI